MIYFALKGLNNLIRVGTLGKNETILDNTNKNKTKVDYEKPNSNMNILKFGMFDNWINSVFFPMKILYSEQYLRQSNSRWFVFPLLEPRL